MTRRMWPVLCLIALAACGGRQAGRAATAPDPLSEVPAAQLFARGVQLQEAGDLIRAEQYLVAAMERGYPDKDVLAPLLAVCVAGSRFQAALAHAQRYLARHPEDWALRYLTASLYVAVGDAPTALAELDRVLGQRPRLAEAHYARAVIYRDELHDDDRAQAAFERYLALDPGGGKAVAARAWLVWRAHRRVGDSAPPAGAPPAGAPPVSTARPPQTPPASQPVVTPPPAGPSSHAHPVEVPPHDPQTDL